MCPEPKGFDQNVCTSLSLEALHKGTFILSLSETLSAGIRTFASSAAQPLWSPRPSDPWGSTCCGYNWWVCGRCTLWLCRQCLYLRVRGRATAALAGG
jgi:hypothetical protein